MNEQVFTNYRLLLPDKEVLGTLVVRDGRIADIQPDRVQKGLDGNGEYLLPGLIELHTDNLERCMSPRPGVFWPLEAAAVYHDRDIISAGITTVCDAIGIGDVDSNSLRMTHFTEIIDTICEGQAAGYFEAEHRLHLRCELGYEHVHRVATQYATRPELSLVSLMDHTPGQRQFVDLDKYKAYYQGKHGVPEEQIEEFIQLRLQEQRNYAQKNRQALVELTQHHQVTLASHDDATIEHIREAIRDGAEIAEFPTTLEAARSARAAGLQILMGAPNLILGGSHSGNVSTLELIQRDLVDIISSDYVPRSLLHAPFFIARETGKPLYELVRMVASNPAKAIDLLRDRGSLEVGKRADLVAVAADKNVPRLTSVWRKGRRVG